MLYDIETKTSRFCYEVVYKIVRLILLEINQHPQLILSLLTMGVLEKIWSNLNLSNENMYELKHFAHIWFFFTLRKYFKFIMFWNTIEIQINIARIQIYIIFYFCNIKFFVYMALWFYNIYFSLLKSKTRKLFIFLKYFYFIVFYPYFPK